MKKIISNIIFYTIILLNFGSVVFANEITLGSTVEGALTDIIEILLLVGAGVCVFKVIQIGIMYVTSSAVDKSNAKQAILPWLIGTFLCFGAATIGGYIIDILKVDGPVLGY